MSYRDYKFLIKHLVGTLLSLSGSKFVGQGKHHSGALGLPSDSTGSRASMGRVSLALQEFLLFIFLPEMDKSLNLCTSVYTFVRWG
jgi:hypothetical protein